MTIGFMYDVTGTGWGEVVFVNDKERIEFYVSYLSDPLSELLDSLYRLIKSESDKEYIAFYEEPEVHTLIITMVTSLDAKIEIVWNEDHFGGGNVRSGTSVYHDTDSLRNFITTILDGVYTLLQRITIEEYNENWHLYQFPIDSYERLKQALIDIV